MQAILQTIREEHAKAVEGFLDASGKDIELLAELCAAAISKGNKLLFCGNGGSACDAMHIAGEFVGRFIDDRRALPAIALSADVGIITAVANDYHYDYIFARQVEALGRPGDVLICISTSGSSPNVVRAIASGAQMGLVTVLFTGEKGMENKAGAAHLLAVPSRITAHVQEAHMVVLHALAKLIEFRLFS